MDRVDDILAQWHRERPDLDVAPMGLIGRINRLSHHLGRGMEKTFAAHGLTAASFDVLATLRRSGRPYSLSPGDLLGTMMITSGTLTNRIDQLEKAGLVERRQNPEDGRSVLIALTEKGFAVIDATVTAHVATQARLIEGLSKQDRVALDALLSRYLKVFESGTSEGKS
ncbi:DNA-binding transcriptional regulator, MarR family [Enhydrobacter aerosaccus]|uniref:DNA-binding transcriptional regulator, MarR family n=1 Tax=Enhydrobacter aerosaccus TaxID=225324 RepID=A0A1T4PFG7_9HYPH|nr:MarR family transcriptional regulator [Enhydrobacter aerosaccus]SJZ90111.1 DNA-binding transcriptional regulator, MarR family [Enhydrobacter aerosaccus]